MAHALHAHPNSLEPRAGFMSSLQLDGGVRTLRVTKLDSYEKLEIMRALRGARPAMSRSELEAACRLSSDAIDDALSSLERSKLIELDPVDHRIRVGAASADPCFATLMQIYDEDRAGVLAVLGGQLARVPRRQVLEVHSFERDDVAAYLRRRLGDHAGADRLARLVDRVQANVAKLRQALVDQADLREIFQAMFPDGLTVEPTRTPDGSRQIWNISDEADFAVIIDNR